MHVSNLIDWFPLRIYRQWMSFISGVICLASLFGLPVQVCGQAVVVDFVRDVRPILVRYCDECHGAQKQKSGLRLDIKSEALKGGHAYGPIVVAGNVDDSPLIELVMSTDMDERMPPVGDGLSLSELEMLRLWVEQGAAWPDGIDLVQLEDRTDHWSFKPVVAVAPPVGDADVESLHAVGQNAIDAFVSSRLSENSLALSPAADRLTWLRRVTFDLIGLPPTPADIREFINDTRSDAFERVVDKLLKSPRYGERWGQHWLDVVRYADTDGFEVNTARPNAWPYRDYVINAFNEDLPYDRFVYEQIAGDALNVDAATGFLVTAAALLPGQIGQDEESKRLARQDELAEMIINTGEAFLGLSIGCARCHDHKFDAISQHDYYAMQAFFSGVHYGERPVVSSESAATEANVEALKQRIAEYERLIADLLTSHSQVDTNATLNEMTFERREAKFVRFTIHDANRHPSLGLIEPCIDEFEIFSAVDPSLNVALARFGSKVTASGSRTSEIHRLEHIHDGQFGNSHSWMSDQAGQGWLLFELPELTLIDRIVWSRDRLGEFDDRLATLLTLEIGKARDDLEHVAGLTASDASRLLELRDQKQALEQQLAALNKAPMVFAGQFTTPEPTYLLSRGDPEQPLTEVSPAVLAAFGNLQLPNNSPDQARRQGLAHWIASSDNPLTARVMVNRIWQWHFGVGLVETASDFGRSGHRPTHAELLDWLASEFMNSGWSIKHMHRLIVLSETYGQSSQIENQSQANKANEIDADVRLLWRFPTRRLEAEAIRDSMLAVSGRLDLKVGGPGFDLFQSRGGLSGFPPVESFSGDGLRRMVYAHKIRMEREAVFGAFDCPDAGQSMARRRQSTTPIQALNLLNSRFTMEEAQALADRIMHMSPKDIRQQIQLVYELSLGRSATIAEYDDAEPVVQAYGLVTLCRAIFNSNEFLFIP